MDKSLALAGMEVGEFDEGDINAAFDQVLQTHGSFVKSIQQSMADAAEVYAKYTLEGYEAREDIARKDRASLNRSEKHIAECFAELKAIYTRPMAQIESNVKAVRDAIRNASETIDGVVKESEARDKAIKQREIAAYFESLSCDLITLDRIFDQRWLNKTFKMSEVRSAIDKAIAAIHSDLKTIESAGEHSDAAKALYLETLDLGVALRHLQTIREKARCLEAEREGRAERERQAALESNRADLRKEAARYTIEDNATSIALAAAEDTDREANVQTEGIMSFDLRFFGTRAQLLKLREYMNTHGITYERLDAQTA